MFHDAHPAQETLSSAFSRYSIPVPAPGVTLNRDLEKTMCESEKEKVSPLLAALEKEAGACYPFHMPGHKRRADGLPGILPYSIDFTEISGTDDLHAAEGILRDAMQRTAALYGAARTWYLVNGSSCGNLAALAAATYPGDEIIAARNCHRSVWHAAELRELRVHTIDPAVDEAFCVSGSVTPEAVEEALRQHPDAGAVVVTSPTYEGVLSDIRSIAELCHAHGIPLIVDEAHGAHLGLRFPGGSGPEAYGFPGGAIRCGADVVVQSVHKLLPGLTQTAWLHRSRESLIGEAALAHQLDIFETSSPSYPLMVSMDACTGFLLTEGERRLAQWQAMLAAFDRAVSGLRRLKILCHGGDPAGAHAFYAFDPSKLYISASGAGMTGAELAGILRGRFRMEMEMSCGDSVLAMTSPMDSPEALQQLAEALLTIDREAGEGRIPMDGRPPAERAVCRGGGRGSREFPAESTAAAVTTAGSSHAESAAAAATAAGSSHAESASSAVTTAERPPQSPLRLRVLAGEQETADGRELTIAQALRAARGEQPRRRDGFAQEMERKSARETSHDAAYDTEYGTAYATARGLDGRGAAVALPAREAAGRISAEYVWCYPPGVPLLLPGERVTEEALARLERLAAAGTGIYQGR